MDSWAAYKKTYIYIYTSILQVSSGKWPTSTQPTAPVFFNNALSFFGGEGFYYSRTPSSPRSVRQERIGHFIFIEIHSHDHRRGRRGNHAWGVKNATRTFLWGSTFWVVFFEMRSIFEDTRFCQWNFGKGMFTKWFMNHEKPDLFVLSFVFFLWSLTVGRGFPQFLKVLYFNQLKLVNFETIDTCRVPYQAVYICISFSRFWLMGPIVPLIRKWGAQQITRCLILTWNAVERPRNVLKCRMEKVIQDCLYRGLPK